MAISGVRGSAVMTRVRVPFLAVVAALAMVAAGMSLWAPPAHAAVTPRTTATVRTTARAKDFTAAGASDVAVDGEGASDGYHVRVARASGGFGWTDIAVIQPAGMDEQTWYGYQCVTGDGKYVAVAILPGDAINDNTSRDRGAYAYEVNVTTHAVTALASGVALMYHTPGCGVGDTAVFTAALGTNEQTTQVLEYNLATGKQTDQSMVSGQVTSVVPTGQGLVGALGSTLVAIPSGGSAAHPVATRRVMRTAGRPFDLRANSAGGADFLAESANAKTASVWHESRGSGTQVGSGSIQNVGLFEGSGGHNRVVGAVVHGSAISSLGSSSLPLGAQIVSLGGGAEFGPNKTDTHTKTGPATAAQAQAVGADAPLVEATRTHKVFTAAHALVAPSSTATTGAVKQARGTGKQLTGQGPAEPQAQLPHEDESKTSKTSGTVGHRSVFVHTGPLTPAAAVDVHPVSSSSLSVVPAVSPQAATPECAVARLDPTLEAMQPSNAQVDWATQMDEQGLLVGSQYARPANFANMGLVSYDPSSDFPPIGLDHPSSDSWTTVPRSVMLAIEAQESNFDQASWHALPGIAGDPLIADYYGAGDSISTIDYPNADCGYGVAQVTDGMAAGDTWLSTHGQMKVAVDYEENIAAGLQILEKTWNELYGEGITANGGDPRYLENWYFAAWAYNTGIQPDGAYGNTTGCTPGPSCEGPDGTWGLGWSNNPANPDYDPSRQPYLKDTYADAAHPSSWPYQERIMGWMGASIIRYGYTAYNPPTYAAGQSWLQIPAFDSFCTTAANDCNPSTGQCGLSDYECWWHQPATWVSSCSTTCATSSYEDASGSSLPSYTPRYTPTCNQNTSVVPSSAIIVDDLTDPNDDDQGCSGMNWSNGGTFTYSPGQNSSGDPVGDVDTHQLGSGFGGHILFTHTEPASDTELINTGTWTPTLPSKQYYRIKIHIPAGGATATDVTYTVHPGGGGAVTKIRVNQDWGSEQWVTIGTVAMENGGYVTLTNASGNTAGAYDVAYDAIAFVPEGGTPGIPIGGPPTIEDEPAGSNPALVNCGCATRTAGDPVDTGTGYFSQSATDLSIPGLGEPLNLARTYTSSLADPSGPAGADAVNGAFGPGWTFSYGLSAATATNGNVTITQEDGSQVAFSDSSGTYAPEARYDATLTASGGDYYFTRHGAEQFVFSQTTGDLLSESDQAGRAASPTYATTLSYNTSGQLSTVTDPAGRTLTFTWASGHITKATDSGGQEVDYGYNTAGDLTDVWGVGTVRTGGSNGDQDHAQYAYNSSGLMTSMRTPANYGKTGTPTPVTSMTYDSSERVVSQTDPDGNTTAFEYGPNTTDGLTAGQTLVTDPAGHKILYTYTEGLLTSETKGYGTSGAQTWQYAYDPVSLGVAQQTNPDGSIETFSYDEAGHQISSSNALGETTSKQYNAAGQVTEETDPDGTQTTTTYNTAGAPTSVLVSDPGQTTGTEDHVLNPTYSRQTTYAYADAAHPGEVTTATDPNGNATTYTYDSYGDLTSQTNAAGKKSEYGYNTALGRKTSTVSPQGVTAGTTTGCTPPATGCTTYAYDAFGNVTTTTDPLGHTTKATFDADGDQLTATDADGDTTTTGYDADDQPTSVEQPSGATSHTTYNGDGTVQKTTDANGHATTYTYTPLGQEATMANPDGKTTTYTYNSMGQVATETTPDGEVTTNTWDSAGELTGISYSGGATTPQVSYTYDPAGQRLTMTDGTGTTSYSYDVFGETTSVTDGSGDTVGYAYDADGSPTTISYPGAGNTVTDTYNDLQQLTEVTDPAGNTTRFGYTPDGQPATTTASNGTVSTTAYDGDDRASSTALTNGSVGLGTLTYTRDADGNLTGTTPTAGAPGQAQTYTYTKDQRLSGTVTGQTTTGYGYDQAGDPTTLGDATQVFDSAGQLCWTTTSTVTSPTCSAPATGATVYATNGDGQRTSKTPASGTATAYGYDAAGRLSTVSGAVSASYAYNGDGLRMSKTLGQATTVFTWDTTGQVPELLSDGTEFYVYGPGGQVVEQFTTGGANPQWYFTDAHGSTIALTGASGTVDGTYTYNAWGAQTGHTGTASTPIGFAGAYQDTGTGFLYLQARYYDPATALFLTVDPDVQKTLTAYLYTSDNPLNLLDPLGLFSWTLSLTFASIAVGLSAVGDALDFTGAGAVLGAVVDGAAFVAGGFATASDCWGAFGQKKNAGMCALDVAGEATAGFGFALDATDVVKAAETETRTLLERASAVQGSFFSAVGGASALHDGFSESAGSGSGQRSSRGGSSYGGGYAFGC